MKNVMLVVMMLGVASCGGNDRERCQDRTGKDCTKAEIARSISDDCATLGACYSLSSYTEERVISGSDTEVYCCITTSWRTTNSCLPYSENKKRLDQCRDDVANGRFPQGSWLW